MNSANTSKSEASENACNNASGWRAGRLDLALVVSVQIVLLAVALLSNPWIINADGVAYMRLATYYAQGPLNLAVSGYWGPLLSWLMAPFIKFGMAPTDAARVVLGVSAVIFLLGSIALLRRLQLPRWAVRICSWTVMLASVSWATDQITPDLLVAGFIAFALSEVLSPNWVESRAGAIRAGAWWGVAYLAKAIAFPMCFIASAALGGVWMLTRGATRTQIIRSLELTWLVMLVITAPWITVLSLKYHHFTFSTTGRIAHAIGGPKDVERYHPLSTTFHKPDPGRITQWEDPSLMPYRYWSPLESADYAKHQLTLIGTHALTLFSILRQFDFLGLGVVAMVLTLLGRGSLGEKFARDRWRWAVVPVACLAALYAPVSAGEDRFFYVAFGLMEATALGAAVTFIRAERLRRLCIGLSAVCFAGPALLSFYVVVAGFNQPMAARVVDLAARLKTQGLGGPIAGSGTVGGYRTGLYIAFLTGQQWYGDQPKPTAASFKSSGAKVVLVRRDQAVAGELAKDPAFRNLDREMFDSAEVAEKSVLQFFEVKER